jgi:ABC-type branched-subunit amino acid transport system substrate-binding protein
MAILGNQRLAARRARRASPLLGLVCVAVMVLAGCGGSASSGSTFKVDKGVDLANKTITVGIISALSGPVGQLIGIPLTQGIETYFKDINAHGGIDGFQIKWIEKDNKYPDTTTEVQVYQEIHNQVAMLAENLGTPTTFAIKDQVNADHLLTSVASLDSYLARQKYMVLVGTPYRLQVENAFDYVVNKLGIASPKTAIIYQNDAYGQDGLQGYKESISAYSLNDVGQVPFTPGSADYTAQAAQLKASGAKYVFVTATPTDAAVILGTAAHIGYFPQWILQSPAFHPVLLTTPVAPILEHFAWVMGQGAAWGDPKVPGMATMLQDVQTYQPDETPNGFFEFGYAEAIVTAAILKRAADNQDLSRAGLLNAFNSLGTVTFGGILPESYYGSSPNQRVPTRDSSVYALDPTQPGGVKNLSGDFTGTAAMASQF